MGRVNGHQLGGVDGAALDRFHRRHSILNHQYALIAGKIIFVEGSSRVGSQGDLNSGLMGAAEGVLMSLDGVLHLADHVIRDSRGGSVYLDPVGSGQRRNKEYVMLLHEVEAPVVHEETMLDGVNSGSQRVFDPSHTLGMGEGLGACLVGFFDSGSQLFLRQLGRTRLYAFGHNAAGSHNLDPGGACL